MEDIIKFGLGELLQSDASSVEVKDFTAILGPTVDGVWQHADSSVNSSHTIYQLSSAHMETAI